MKAPLRPRVGSRRWFNVDRIVVLRAALVVIGLLFLYLVVRVAIHAFGGGGERLAKRIEHAIDNDALPAGAPGAGATKPVTVTK